MRVKASSAVAEARCCSWKGMGQDHWAYQSQSRRSFRAGHIPALVDQCGSGRLGSGSMKRRIQLVLLVHHSASWAGVEVGKSVALAAEASAVFLVPL